MTERLDPHAPLGPEGDETTVTSPAIGKDEWVARHYDRRLPPRLREVRGADPRRCRGGSGSASSSAPPACSRSSRRAATYASIGFNTVLYMLLALGLNVVVGWGGLLDLGYVAFYGIGAYAYALLDLRPLRDPPVVDRPRSRSSW